jgi:iron-sulfur cluster repair protein YtfE (RIC family)
MPQDPAHLEEITRLNAEIARLTAERDDFKAKAEPVQKQLAAKLAQHGIRAEAVQGATVRTGHGATATERCMAEKGIVIS